MSLDVRLDEVQHLINALVEGAGRLVDRQVQ
jgi:hypothetical protein